MDTQWVTLMLPVVVPVLLALVRLVVPKIPKVAIPVLAPVLGAALEILGYYGGLTNGNPIAGAIYGGLGVLVREVVDQIRKAVAPPA